MAHLPCTPYLSPPFVSDNRHPPSTLSAVYSKSFEMLYQSVSYFAYVLGGGFKHLLIFTPPWGKDPIWRAYYIFQKDWNHQLVIVHEK